MLANIISTIVSDILVHLSPGVVFLLALDFVLLLVFNHISFILIARMLGKPEPGLMSSLLPALPLSVLLYYCTFHLNWALYPMYLLYFFLVCVFIFKAPIKKAIFISTAFIINITALRGIITNALTFAFHMTYAEFYADFLKMLIQGALTSVAFILAAAIIMKEIKEEILSTIMDSNFEMKIIITHLVIVSIYNLIDATRYTSHVPMYDFYLPNILKNTTFMIAGYLLLLYMARINELSVFEQKSRELQQEVHTQENLRRAMEQDVQAVYGINLTKDIFISGLEATEKIISEYDLLPEVARRLLDSFKLNYSRAAVAVARIFIIPEDRKQFLEACNRSTLMQGFEEGQRKKHVSFRTRFNNQKEFVWVEITLNLYQDAGSGDIMMVALLRDITLDMESLEQLSAMAIKDSLLDVYNRRYTEELVADALKSSAGTFVIFDIDDLKNINDTGGHKVGDEVLHRTVSRIKSILSKSDIFGRVGGDEFVIFLEGIANRDSAKVAVQNILDKSYVHMKKETDGCEICSSVSIGVCVVKEAGAQYSDVFKCADKALYVSKNAGKGKYTFANDYFVGDAKSPDSGTDI